MAITRIFCVAAAIFAANWSTAPLYAQGFFDELFEPWPDEHASPRGTPYVHPFFAEPAYLDRDVLVDYVLTNGVDGAADERELAFEAEWALTKRLGIVFEAPLVAVDEDNGPYEDGFGDLAVGGRALLVEQSRFLLSGFVELEIPTGDEDRGLGEGETKLFPALLWWMDLGSWTTFQGQVGPEIGLESGETEMLYFLALTRSWQGPVIVDHACRCCRRRCHHGHNEEHDDHEEHDNHEGHDHDDHSHHAPGLITLYLEATGVTPLSSAEPTQFEIAPGVSYSLTEALELRTAFRVPLYRPERFDHEYVFSLIRHF